MTYDTFSGTDAYLALMVQAGNQCPFSTTRIDANTGDATLQNAIFYVSTTYAIAAYKSFTALLAVNPALKAWVGNADTGEVRYYDGTAAGDATKYFSIEQMACARIKNFKPSIERPVTQERELGSMNAPALKAHQYTYNFSFDKVYVDKRKLAALSYTDPTDHQLNFLGIGAVLVPETTKTSKQNYWLAVISWRNLDVAHGAVVDVAESLFLPCCKFSTVSINSENDREVDCSLSGTATYSRAIPKDNLTDFQYVAAYS